MNAGTRPQLPLDHDVLDPYRDGPPHVGLGHGMRLCIGATPVRIELRAVFATLFHRLPDLRLAVPPAGSRCTVTASPAG